MRNPDDSPSLEYRLVETPWGWGAVTTRGRGLWRSCSCQDSASQALRTLQLPEESVEAGDRPLLNAAATDLTRYFGGEPVEPSLTFDLADETEFVAAILTQCSRIPWGPAVSYGELAARAGRPRAARAVGQAMSRNPLAPFVPCHRVVGADGSLTGFGGGLDLKARMLALEGQEVISTPPGKPRLRPTAR